jgi:hypothetical protein
MHLSSFFAWRLRFALALARRMGLGRRKKICGRVLCILTGGLGDKLMALPAVRHLRHEFPDSEFTLVICGIAPPCFAGEADRFLSVPAPNTLELIRIALSGFDTCFVNSIGIFDTRFELMAFLSGGTDLRGPIHLSQGGSRTVYTRPYVFGDGHETVINFRGAGGRTEEKHLEYLLDWQPCPALGAMPDLLLHPGSSATGIINRWPPESYAFVARDFYSKGHTVLAIGSPQEKSLLEDLREKSGGSIQIRHDLDLQGLLPLLAGAGLVIANDSGIGHLAASVGANLITVMGANRPGEVAPVGSNVFVIGSRCEYGGCYGTPHAAHCKLCIQKIAPQEVLDAAWVRWKRAGVS